MSNIFRTHLTKLISRSIYHLTIQSNNQSKTNVIYHKIHIPTRFQCTSAPSHGPNIQEISNGDPELEHKLKVLILEVEVMRQEGRLVPDDGHLKDHHWAELLKLPTISARRRFLEFQFKISKKKENRQVKKEQTRLERAEFLQNTKIKSDTFEEYVHKYDLSNNNIFLRFYDTTINQMYNNRLIQAMQFGQKLVVDCGYHENMTERENKNCAKQLMLLFAENRAHDDPFDLYFCNHKRDSTLGLSLHRFIATMYEPWFPLNVHEQSYTELFPKEKLVYLTPHCREELAEYDHDAVYIIGGIVDKVNNEPLSLAKAKKEGIRMAKFPLDRYLQWSAGSGKSLTLNQVAAILLDVKHTNDWAHALRHVPRRKLADESSNRPQDGRKVWTPAKNIDFGRISFNGNRKSERLVKVKSIFNDDDDEVHKNKIRR